MSPAQSISLLGLVRNEVQLHLAVILTL